MANDVSPNQLQYGFALHTTTPQLGLGTIQLASGEQRSQSWELGRELSSTLQVRIQDYLKNRSWEDLEFIAVAKGPGGFTSTRIGVVTARTLAQHLDLPLYGISTLAAIAWKLGKEKVGEKIGVSLPARRGEIFGAIYQITEAGVDIIVEDQLFLPDSFAALAEQEKAVVGRSPEALELGHTVDAVLELAYLRWQHNPVSPWGEVVPFYGQHPVHKIQAR